jgi:hypothetical protein
MKILQILLLAVLLLVPQTVALQQQLPSIRSIDFANFSYPWPKDLIDPTNPQKTFTLRDGKHQGNCNYQKFIEKEGVTLGNVTYADVTGDGAEEAILTMHIQTCGSAMPGLVYIYMLRGSSPKLLWGFSTGDRADGGLHKVYAENHELVVELNGPERRWEGDCCPMRFTRRHYVWRSNRFRQKGSSQVIPISTQ